MMVIIEIESISRSSVNDLSRATASVAIPVSSWMSSAIPASTSSVDDAMCFSLSWVQGTVDSLRAGRCLGGCRAELRQNDNLCAKYQTGTEANLWRESAREFGMLREQTVR